MLLIGENINIMSRRLGPAIRNKDPRPIQETAVQEEAAGMDYLDLNLGPARKGGPETMSWLVKTVQEVVNLPLSLDTTNVEALEAGLKAHRGKAIINSISCRPERMAALLPLAKKYEADFVGLLLGVEGIPRDADERAALAAELLARTAEEGIAPERIWLDPIVLPVTNQQDQVKECTQFMALFQEADTGCNFTCGLSNVSNGAPEELRPILNQAYLLMLRKNGMNSAIVDAFDQQLVAVARGQRQDLEELAAAAMEGREPDIKTLQEEPTAYLKTFQVLMGHNLYSHSWLKL